MPYPEILVKQVSRRYNISHMESQKIASLVERLGNLLRSEDRVTGSGSGLQPIHMQILRYMSVCNRYSNTPAGVGEFVGATKGTTSQSINVLERKGFLKKRPDKEDGRVIHLGLTAKAEHFLEKEFPPPEFTDAVTAMKPGDRNQLSGLLNELLILLQRQNEGKAFGVCHTCRYFKRDRLGDSHQCGLTREPLTEQESFMICREHDYPSEKAL
jgi:DNA-binding MarR family transcriptional regulator